MESFIPTENLEALQQTVNKALRKGAKLGLTSFSLNITDEKELRKFKDGNDKPYFVEYTKVVLEGDHPTFEGWKLIAVIELVPVLGSVAKVVPGEVLPEQYFNHNNICQHCNTRRQRKQNYIVQNINTGEYMSVGSTCLKDFLGGKDAQAIIWMMSFLSSMSNFGSTYGNHMREQSLYEIEDVLSITVASIEEHGWTSSASARNSEWVRSTVSRVVEHMFNNHPDAHRYTVTDVHTKKSQEVIEYFKTMINDKGSDYIANCKKFAQYGYLNQTSFGLACSMVNSYNKQMVFAEKKEKSAPRSNLFVGTIGQKIEINLKYIKSVAYNGMYGCGFFHLFEDEAGNDLVWSTSCNINSEEGTIHRVKGTVKKHDTYKDRNSTHLTRCKILNVR